MELRQFWFSSSRMARDQRARVADADPPHEVGDGEAPHHRHADAPDAHALGQQQRHGRTGRSAAAEPTAKPASQTIGVRLVSTMAAIWSVTEPKVYPGDDVRRRCSTAVNLAIG